MDLLAKFDSGQYRLPNHPAFLRLKEKDRHHLQSGAELWQVPSGGHVYYPGDRADSLILVMSGLLLSEHQGSGSVQLYFPDDLWGIPEQTPEGDLSLVACEDTVFLQWSWQTLLHMTARSRSLGRNLNAMYNQQNQLVSGLPLNMSVPAKNTGSRKIPVTLKPALPLLVLALVCALVPLPLLQGIQEQGNRNGNSILVLPAIVMGLYVLWFLAFLLQSLFIDYRISSNAVSASSIDWTHVFGERRRIPAGEIRGIEVRRNRFFRKLLNYGTLVIKTAASGGTVQMNNISKPESVAQSIRDLVARNSEVHKATEMESMRRSLESAGLDTLAPRLVHAGRLTNNMPVAKQDARFRKSLAVLAGQLCAPLLVLGLCLVPMLFINRIIPGIPAVPGFLWCLLLVPLAWVWYRLENWRNDRFGISGSCAVDLYRKPLGMGETSRKVELLSLQTIRIEQKGFLAFLFRFGDVILVSAGGGSDTVFRGVSRPWQIQEALFSQREFLLREQEQQHKQRQKDDLITYTRVIQQMDSNNPDRQ